jgi:hypothetical protein
MVSVKHYPHPDEPSPQWADDLARIERDLAAEDARDAADGVDVWDRVFPPAAPGVDDIDAAHVRDNYARPIDIGEPWPRGWLGKLIVNALFYAAWLALGAGAGWLAVGGAG